LTAYGIGKGMAVETSAHFSEEPFPAARIRSGPISKSPLRVEISVWHEAQ
jgi:hypothetical protein